VPTVMFRGRVVLTGVPARATGAGRHPIGSPTLGCARNPGDNVVVFETVFQHRAHQPGGPATLPDQPAWRATASAAALAASGSPRYPQDRTDRSSDRR
jgi:hypothetical protein